MTSIVKNDGDNNQKGRQFRQRAIEAIAQQSNAELQNCRCY
ncbi:hypothetical protein ABMX68_14630 [Vibrio vulnificus]|nr:hypothetical protein [Vibrio vulnificus]